MPPPLSRWTLHAVARGESARVCHRLGDRYVARTGSDRLECGPSVTRECHTTLSGRQRSLQRGHGQDLGLGPQGTVHENQGEHAPLRYGAGSPRSAVHPKASWMKRRWFGLKFEAATNGKERLRSEVQLTVHVDRLMQSYHICPIASIFVCFFHQCRRMVLVICVCDEFRQSLSNCNRWLVTQATTTDFWTDTSGAVIS